jgi:hypothetical protein
MRLKKRSVSGLVCALATLVVTGSGLTGMAGGVAEGATLPVTYNSVTYQVTTITGTVDDLYDVLRVQPWVGNVDFASSGVDSLRSLGLLNNYAGLGPVGPMFAYGVYAPPGNSVAECYLPQYSVNAALSVFPGQSYTFAVDSATLPVPEPAAALPVALAGMLLRRRR